MRSLRSPRPTRAGGFTIVELLVVITILALLMSIGMYSYGKYIASANETKTKAQLQALNALLEMYRNRTGDYPKSRLADLAVKSNNSTNEGIEAMLVAFYLKTYDGERPDEADLINLDEDRIEGTNPTINPEPRLNEFKDAWENPLAYIQYSDFEREQEYQSIDAETSTLETTMVKAEKNPQTGTYYARDSFQLRSAGQDGVFGTDDDIASYR